MCQVDLARHFFTDFRRIIAVKLLTHSFVLTRYFCLIVKVVVPSEELCHHLRGDTHVLDFLPSCIITIRVLYDEPQMHYFKWIPHTLD